jgi:hypothetical protein
MGLDRSSGPIPGESGPERVDRELIELLNELRVALPGVQVLFAFLLTVPFSIGFQRLTRLQRNAYFVAFVLAAMSAALLIAPSSYHRLRFRTGDKERMLFTSNKLAIWGLALLAMAMACAVFVVTDVLFGAPAAAGVTAGIAGWLTWFWFGIPLGRILADRRSATGS